MEENKTHSSNNLEDKILKAIKSGEVKMRPRWYFVLQSALFALGLILIALSLLYVTSFTFFTIHESGYRMPPLEILALRDFLLGMPWLLIALAIAFIVLLEHLVKKFSFGYRKPLLYSVLGIIVVAIVGGIIISQTSFHSRYSRNLYRRLDTRGYIHHPAGFPIRSSFPVGLNRVI